MYHIQALSRISLILAVLSLLAACGFQLRGVGGPVVPDEWKALYLETNNPNSEFTRAIIAQFGANGIEWVELEDANYRIMLGSEKFSQRNLSLNSEARVSELELTMSASYEVRDATSGETVIESTTASVVKQMEDNPRNVVGKQGELSLLKDEMRNELATQIMRQIGFYAAYLQSQSGSP